MKYEYELGKYECPYFYFIFSDNKYSKVRLGEEYPRYKLVRNRFVDEEWDYTIIESRSDPSLINTVKAFNVNDLKERKLLYMEVRDGDITYRMSTQMEFDRHKFHTDPNSDNGKLYFEFLNLRKGFVRETIL